VRDDIVEGRFYELNLCQCYRAFGVIANPFDLIQRQRIMTPAPFSSYFKYKDMHVFCASMERFFLKRGDSIVCQPIKGTNSRGDDNDLRLNELFQSEKDRAENLMIVDLMRNDLAKVCETGTIEVQELFGAYPYANLNHLVSTIKGQLKKGMRYRDILQALFPMGSMTGAPKIEVMKAIGEYEKGQRGLYSGTIGYILPNGNSDFNVVIRSLIYDHARSELTYHSGGAITFDSDPQQEWEECLLKAGGIIGLFKDQPG
jgi:para-aminobenzoate synthetase component 1